MSLFQKTGTLAMNFYKCLQRQRGKHMLKVTYGQLRDQNFARGVMKLANCAQLKSPKVAYNVAKLNARFVEEAKLADELYNKLIDQYAKKTEDGKLEPHDGRPGTFFIPEERTAEWGEKLKEFHAISFEVDRPALNLDEVMVAQISPAEISALEPILHYSEAAPAEVKPLAKA